MFFPQIFACILDYFFRKGSHQTIHRSRDGTPARKLFRKVIKALCFHHYYIVVIYLLCSSQLPNKLVKSFSMGFMAIEVVGISGSRFECESNRILDLNRTLQSMQSDFSGTIMESSLPSTQVVKQCFCRKMICEKEVYWLKILHLTNLVS